VTVRALAILLILVALVRPSALAPGAAVADDTADTVACNRLADPEKVAVCSKYLESLAARIRKTPNEPSLYIMRADVYQHIGDLPRAIAELDRVIKLKPNEGFYLLRSGLKGKNRNLNGAIEDANQALRLNPKSVGAHMYLGYAYGNKQDLPRAIAEFTRVIELDPKQTDAYLGRAAAYIVQHDKAAAEADCQHALALMPKRDGDMGYDGKGHTVRCHPESAAP